MSGPFFVWQSQTDGSFSVSRHHDKEFVCDCGHGDLARDHAHRICDALNGVLLRQVREDMYEYGHVAGTTMIAIDAALAKEEEK